MVLSFYPRKTQDEPGHPDLMPMASQNGELSGITITSHVCVCSDTTGSLQPYRLYPTRFFCPWDFQGKNIEMGSCSLLQGIFLTQELNPALLHCRQILYHLSHQRSPTVCLNSSTAGAGYDACVHRVVCPCFYEACIIYAVFNIYLYFHHFFFNFITFKFK